MVEESEDPEIVTDRIYRETRRFREQLREEREAAGLAQDGALSAASDASASGALVVAEAGTLQPEPPAPPADPDAAFRRVRLGIVAVIVLILFWAWIAQRRGVSK